MVPSSRRPTLAGALVLLAAGGTCCLCVYRYLSGRRRRKRLEPFLRLITNTAQEYHAANPKWLVLAAAQASSPAPDGADPLAAAQLPGPVREPLQQLSAAAGAGQLRLGAAARSALFLLEQGTTYLNHGSYGATLRLASQAQRYFQERLEAQPVRFMETEGLAAIRQAQLALAQEVRAHPADLAFVPNATTAANAVLRSAQPGPGDLLLLADTTYPAVRSAAARVAAERGAALLEVQLLDVLSDPEAVVARYEAALRAGAGRIRLAVIDHIVSLAPAHLPVARLCAAFAAAGVPTLVDGAHAAGAVRLDIPAVGCDYYTSNLHKWVSAPKGAAFLWARRERQAGLLPPVTSHGHGLGFQGEFLWAGTADSSAIMALPTAMAVWRALGPAAADYRCSLLQQAVALLLHSWGTQAALGVEAPGACMSAVELPPFSDRPPSSQLAAAVHDALRQQHGIEVPVACAGGRMWCRISAQIYNELSDYQKLAGAVQQLAAAGGLAAGQPSEALLPASQA